jgi:hypothetical protein
MEGSLMSSRIIVKSIISYVILIVLINCNNNDKPLHKYDQRLISIAIDSIYIKQQLSLSYQQANKLCDSRIKNCIIFSENQTERPDSGCVLNLALINSSYSGKVKVKILYDCFCNGYYFFKDTNSTAFAYALITDGCSKTVFYENTGLLRKLNKKQSFPISNSFNISCAYVSGNDAYRILIGDRIYIPFIESLHYDSATAIADSNSVKIDFTKEFSVNNDIVAGIIFTKKEQ